MSTARVPSVCCKVIKRRNILQMNIVNLSPEYSTYGKSRGLPPKLSVSRNPQVHNTQPFGPETVSDLLCDPTEKLEKLLDGPMFGENEKPYRPSQEELLFAQENIFTSKKPNDIRFLEKTIDPHQAPLYNLPEVAFLGRSNVGKSSLIRAIFNKVPALKVPVSKIAGYTKSLRFYQVKNYFTLVDCPGYGFGEPEYFKTCVEGFLRHRHNLTRVFFLIDAKAAHPVDWKIMEQTGLPYCIVLNKIDLVGETARLKLIAQMRQMREELTSPCCFPQPFLVSSQTGEGLALIQSFIAHITGSYELASFTPKSKSRWI